MSLRHSVTTWHHALLLGVGNATRCRVVFRGVNSTVTKHIDFFISTEWDSAFENGTVRSPQHITDSTETATPPKSTSSRNSNSLFFLVHFRFDFVLRDTEKSEFLDLVDFESVANSEETAIRCSLKCRATLIKHTDYFVCTEQDSNTHTHTTKKRKKCE